MKNVSPKNFEIFKKESLRLQKEWGLNGWQLFFQFEPLEGTYAQIKTDLEGRTATFCLSSELEDYCVSDPLREAKHEMIHLLISRLYKIGESRFAGGKEYDEAEEEIVRILEKIL